MYMVTVVLATIIVGLIQPYLRALVTYQSFFVLAAGGVLNGFVSASMMKYFGSKDWQFSAFSAAIVLPMYMFMCFGTIEIIEWMERSSSAIPFTRSLYLFSVWVGVTIPLAFVGSYLGFKEFEKTCIETPCKVSSVRRRIPQQPWYLDDFIITPISGLIIFTTIFSEF